MSKDRKPRGVWTLTSSISACGSYFKYKYKHIDALHSCLMKKILYGIQCPMSHIDYNKAFFHDSGKLNIDIFLNEKTCHIFQSVISV